MSKLEFKEPAMNKKHMMMDSLRKKKVQKCESMLDTSRI